MAATKINLTKNICTLLMLMWYGVVPTKIFKHENLSYKNFQIYGNHKISISTNKSILKRVCNTYSSVQTSLSGFDVIMWLQRLVLVPQLCCDRS